MKRKEIFIMLLDRLENYWTPAGALNVMVKVARELDDYMVNLYTSLFEEAAKQEENKPVQHHLNHATSIMKTLLQTTKKGEVQGKAMLNLKKLINQFETLKKG